MGDPPTTVCLRCRVFVGGDGCELGAAHSIADLATEAGVDALRKEIWSAPRFAIGSSPEARMTAIGAVGLGALVGTVAVGPLALLALPVAAGAGLAMRAFGNRPVQKPRGTGAYLRPSYSRRLRRTGAIEGDRGVRAPLSGRECVGYSFFFRADDTFGGPVILAGGAHGGFFLRGADEADWEIAADPGDWRLIAGDDAVVEPVPEAAVDAFLDRLHPSLRSERDGRPTLPFDSVTELCVQSGVEVEAYGRIVAASFSYRSSSRSFRFAKMPQLAVLDTSSAEATR